MATFIEGKQAWKFISLDHGEQSAVDPMYLENSIWGDAPNRIVQLLARPIPRAFPPPKTPTDNPLEITDDLELDSSEGLESQGNFDQDCIEQAYNEILTCAETPRTFTTLPADIHHLIFAQQSVEEMVNLAMTSRYFWSIGQSHIARELRSSVGSWAGSRIMHIGSSHQFTAPDSVLSEEERINWQNRVHCSRCKPCLKAGSLWSSCLGEEYLLSRQEDIFKHSLPAIQNMVSLKGFSKQDREMFESVLIPDGNDYWPKEKSWILRNLTLQNYVRADAVALKPEFMMGPFVTAPGFGHVIMFKTSWTTELDHTMEVTDWCNGAWAGHRLDIVTTEFHEQEMKVFDDETWEDVSDAIVTELHDIFEARGEFWKRRLLQRQNRKAMMDIKPVYF